MFNWILSQLYCYYKFRSNHDSRSRSTRTAAHTESKHCTLNTVEEKTRYILQVVLNTVPPLGPFPPQNSSSPSASRPRASRTWTRTPSPPSRTCPGRRRASAACVPRRPRRRAGSRTTASSSNTLRTSSTTPSFCPGNDRRLLSLLFFRPFVFPLSHTHTHTHTPVGLGAEKAWCPDCDRSK